VNDPSKPWQRNNLVLDLNAGLDVGGTSDPTSFADLVGKVVNIFGTNGKDTPVVVETHVGEGGEVFSFTDNFEAPDTQAGEVWYRVLSGDEHGDGTVPLTSSRDQFLNDVRVISVPFTQGVNTSSEITHTALMSIPEIQAAMLRHLARPILKNLISTGLATGLNASLRTALGNAVSVYLDPVEGFLVDAQGRRLGYSAATGIVEEIPGSIYIGGSDGMGWVFGPVQAPLTFQLTGIGGEHYAEVSGFVGTTAFGVSSSGVLAAGERKTLTVVESINYPPAPKDDRSETLKGQPVTINVLANDTDPDGNLLTVQSVDDANAHGAVEINADGTLTFDPDDGFEGTAEFTYRVSDGEGGTASAKVRVAIPGRPRVIAVSPADGSSVQSLLTVTIDFSEAMAPVSVADVANYAVVLDGIGIPIVSVSYADEDAQHRAVLHLDENMSISSGRVQVRVNGALRSTRGVEIASATDQLLITTLTFAHPGSLDLIPNSLVTVGQTADGTIGVLSATGSFGHSTPMSVATGDFNQDGVMDVVAASGSTRQLVFFYGKDGGGFAAPVDRALASVDETYGNIVTVFTVDWDRNGTTDVAAAYSDSPGDSRYFILLGDGHGGFSHAPETPILLGGSLQIHQAVFADFTGDGRLDIVAPRVDSNWNVVGLGIIGKDPFLGYGVVAELPGPYGSNTPISADLNEDGRPDIATLTSGSIVVGLSTASGFLPARVVTFANTGNVRNFAVGDVTGDGHVDFAIVHDYFSNFRDVHEGTVLTILAGDGRGSFTERPVQSWSRRDVLLRGSAETLVGDMNNDGRLDIVAVGLLKTSAGLFHSSWVWIGDGRGGFAPTTVDPIVFNDNLLGGAPYFTSGMRDLDGDGFLDVLVTHRDESAVRVLLNDRGGAVYPAPYQLFTGPDAINLSDAWQTAIADFNGDGDPDVAILPEESPAVSIYSGRGDGQYDLASAVLGLYNGWLIPGDINHDGITDLIHGVDKTITTVLGHGDGTFHIHSRTSVPDYFVNLPHSLGQLVDTNHDGHLDLMVGVSSTSFAKGYLVFFGNGQGPLFYNANTFVPVPETPGMQPWYSRPAPPVGDLDSDGVADLVIVSGFRLSCHRGNGNGTFSAGLVSDPGSSTGLDSSYEPSISLVPIDVNYDGNLDLLGWAPANLTLYIGDGSGRFNLDVLRTQQLNQLLLGLAPAALYVTDIKVGDFTGDRLGDVAVLTKGSGVNYFRPSQVIIVSGDGVGGFASAQEVYLEHQPVTMDHQPGTRWVDLGAFLLTPSLMPPHLQGDDRIPVDEQVLGGVGPAGTTITLGVDGLTYGQTLVGSDGRWSIELSPPLPIGMHVATFTAMDSEGHFSAQTTRTITVQAPGNRPPQLTLTAPDAGVASQLYTIVIDVTDSSSEDEAAGFSFAIDWGDSTPVQMISAVPGNGDGLSVNHTYAVTGSYAVQVTATDQFGAVSAPSVHNAIIAELPTPPTVSITGPSSGVPGAARSFGFSATDASAEDRAAGFTYRIDWGDGLIETIAASPNNGTGVTANHIFTVAGLYQIEVTATDQDGIESPVKNHDINIAITTPTVNITGPANGVRGQSQTFVVTATDVSADDRAAGVTYYIDWGDGIIETTASSPNNGSGVSAAHVYDVVGAYEIQMMATDQDGIVSLVKNHDITIEVVVVQPEPGNPTQQQVVVGGTPADDVIFVQPAGTRKLKIVVNGSQVLSFRPTGSIVLFGHGGNDVITVHKSIKTKVELFGGDGNDVLTGGTGNDILVGGLSADNLRGGGGHDILIGGLEVDRLTGSGGKDLLIGGTTRYEGNTAALRYFRSVWTSAKSTAQKKATLQNVHKPRRLRKGDTAFDDGVLDAVFAAPADDWLFGT
jgi:hypothetical protein